MLPNDRKVRREDCGVAVVDVRFLFLSLCERLSLRSYLPETLPESQ